jgi:hypothetical protein
MMAFGWRVQTKKEDPTLSNDFRVRYVMVRNMDMENYTLLVALQNRYTDLMKAWVYPPKLNKGVAFLLALLLFFPCVLYVKHSKKELSKANEVNAKLKTEMDALAAEAKALL